MPWFVVYPVPLDGGRFDAAAGDSGYPTHEEAEEQRGAPWQGYGLGSAARKYNPVFIEAADAREAEAEARTRFRREAPTPLEGNGPNA